MLPPLVSAADLVDRLPTDLVNADTKRVQAAIEDASALVRDEAGATWVVDGVVTGLPDIVRTIVFDVARRALDRSFVYGADGQAVEAGGLYLKADEKRRLNGAVASSAGTKPALWTLATTRGDEPDVEYRPVEGGGDPLPWGYTGATPWAAP